MSWIFLSCRAYRKTNQVSAVKKLLDTDNKLEDGTKIIESSKSGTNYFAKGFSFSLLLPCKKYIFKLSFLTFLAGF